MRVNVLDHGYVEFIEDWGHGKAGEAEAGIIEAARQSTQGSFRSWEPYRLCEKCGAWEIDGIDGHIEYTGEGLPCYECDTKASEHKWKKYPRGDMGLLSFLFSGKPQHATPFEFCGMTIEVQAPIFVFREWHRHRTQSYNEMSARYSPLPAFDYMPTPERCLMVDAKNKQAGALSGSEDVSHETALRWLERVARGYEEMEATYQDGLNSGIPKEVARIVLPVGRYSRMRASANLRNWLAFMTLRADPAAQWEIRQFAMEVGKIISERFPRTWSLFVEKL